MKRLRHLLNVIVLLTSLGAAPVFAAPPGNTVFADPQARINDPMILIELGKVAREGKVEAVLTVFRKILQDEKVAKFDLMFFHQAATWIALALYDYPLALNVVQRGIDQCEGYLKAGDADLMGAGDRGIFFHQLNLLRVKSMILALNHKIDEAMATADEVLEKLWAAYEDPQARAAWENPTNYGYFCLFQQVVFPVLEAVQQSAGEEEVRKTFLPWAQAALASEAILLDHFTKAGGGAAPVMAGYQRMLIQGRGQILMLAGLATDSCKVFETYPFAGLDLKAHSYLCYPLMYWGKALVQAGRYEQALAKFQQADEVLAASVKTGNLMMGYSRWWPPYFIGQIHEKTGKADAAIDSYQVAADHLRTLYQGVTSPASRREYAKESDKVYRRLIRLLLGKGKLDEALNRLEESQSKELLDLFGDSLENPRREWPEKYKMEKERIKKELLDLEQQEKAPAEGDKRGGAAGRTPEAVRSKRLKLQDEYAAVVQNAWTEVQAKNPVGAWKKRQGERMAGKGFVNRRVVESPDVQTIIFQTREDPCWVLVAGSGKLEAVRLEASSDQIRKAANRMRRSIVGDRDDWRKNAATVHALLFKPIEDKLAGQGRLLVIPDGALWYIPFAAVVDDKDQLFVQRFRIGIAAGLGMAAELLTHAAAAEAKAAKNLLIFANPDGSLPFASVEGKKIAELAAANGNWKNQLCLEDQGTLATFQREAEKPSVGALHLATHGVLDEAAPLGSFLVFKGGPGVSGRLMIRDIANDLFLRNLGLAVLSACNTAVGELSGGNEVICLQNAFQEAGVPCILASLWEVSDESTARLMVSFYSRLFGGKTAGEAFVEAMREFCAEPPSRWSPFQVYGLP